MSVEHWQRIVNNLDSDIANLEMRKANVDKRAADEAKRAADYNTFSSNVSPATLKSRLRNAESHASASRKAFKESAELQRKIADKRKERNNAHLRLQNELNQERKREYNSYGKVLRGHENNSFQYYPQSIHGFFSQPFVRITKSLKSSDKPKYDVFISHATEDKESFVDEFVQKLQEKDVSVWYDTKELKWGDSMRAKIDAGLRLSRFGIVILSPAYIAEGKYWTKSELDGLFQRETSDEKIILPIWHNLSMKEVMDYSPLIASKKALKTSDMTSDEIVEELLQALN